MKKFIPLIPALALIFCASTWTSDVKTALEFENNVTDTGNAPLTWINTSCPFSSTTVYAGTYSIGPVDTSGMHVRTSGTTSTAFKKIQLTIKAIAAGGAADKEYWTDSNLYCRLYSYSGVMYYHDGHGTEINMGALDSSAWHRYTINYDGAGCTAYLDTTYEGTIATAYQPGYGSVYYNLFNYEGYNTTTFCNCYADNFVMSTNYSDDGNEIPTAPATTPTYTPTFTITPTYTPTFTITPTVTPSLTPYICGWSAQPNAPWDASFLFGYTSFNNQMWKLGGIGNGFYYNEVFSTYNGISWTDHGDASWTPRYRNETKTYNNMLYVFGGIDSGGTWLGDVWHSADGNSWALDTALAAWANHLYNGDSVDGACCYQVLVYDDGGGSAIFLISGQTSGLGPRKTVWKSYNGIAWTLLTSSAAFDGTSGFMSCVFAGKMWIGGGTGTNIGSHVWYSTDGINWTQGGQFYVAGAVLEHGMMTAWGNIMVILSGNPGNPACPTNIVQWSNDGITWHLDTSVTEPVGAAGISVLLGTLFYFGGSYACDNSGSSVYNHVWSADNCGPTFTTTATPTNTYASPTNTPTKTPRLTFTNTVTPSFTSTITATPTFTVTRAVTARSTRTQTVTLTYTPTVTATPTYTITQTKTPNWTKTITPTFTITTTKTCCPTFHVPTATPTLTTAPTPQFNIISSVATYIYGLLPTPTPTADYVP